MGLSVDASSVVLVINNLVFNRGTCSMWNLLNWIRLLCGSISWCFISCPVNQELHGGSYCSSHVLLSMTRLACETYLAEFVFYVDHQLMLHQLPCFPVSNPATLVSCPAYRCPTLLLWSVALLTSVQPCYFGQLSLWSLILCSTLINFLSFDAFLYWICPLVELLFISCPCDH